MVDEPQQMPVNQVIPWSGSAMLCLLELGKRELESAAGL